MFGFGGLSPLRMTLVQSILTPLAARAIFTSKSRAVVAK
jgi:hypothetical protein